MLCPVSNRVRPNTLLQHFSWSLTAVSLAQKPGLTDFCAVASGLMAFLCTSISNSTFKILQLLFDTVVLTFK